MARKLQRFTLSKKANITSCLGAITMPVLFSISTISCEEYYISYTEESFLIHFKLFDFKLYEKKILQTLESTNTIETLGRKYDSFNADSEFKDRFKEVFYNFVKLINNFTYAANQEIPGIENEYISYLIYTINLYDSFYSKEINNSKVVKEYNPKLAYTALTPGSIIYFSGLKYMKQLWDEEIKNNLPSLKNSSFKNLSAFLSKYVYDNSVKLESFVKREKATRPRTVVNNGRKKYRDIYDFYPINYVPERVEYIEEHNYAKKLPENNNATLINNHRKFGIFDVKKESLIIDSKTVNALTFKFNKLYNLNDISVTAHYNKNESGNLLNFIDINFAYRPKLMSFKEFFDFVKKIKFRKSNLLESEIGTGYIDLDKLLQPVDKISAEKFSVFNINTYDFGKFTRGNLASTATGNYGSKHNSKYDKNVFLDYINLLKLDPKSKNTELFITPESWDINDIHKKDWEQLLPNILKSLEKS